MILIDPHSQTVTAWAQPPQTQWLEALREALDCKQIDSTMVAPRICLWFDNMGLLKANAYWSLRDESYRFAGRAIMTGVDRDGMPEALPLPPEDLSRGIDWRPEDRPVAIREELRVEPTEFGPWPRVIRVVDWSEPEEDTTRPPSQAWTVWENEDGTVRVASPEGEDRPFDSYQDAKKWLLEKTLVEHLAEAFDPDGVVATFLPE